MHSHGYRQQLPGGLRLLPSVRGQTQAEAPVGRPAIGPEVFVRRPDGDNELSLEGLAKHDVEKRVDAAVGVSHADGYVIRIEKGETGPMHAQMCQLQNVMGRPTNEERQAYGHGHPRDLLGAHAQAVLGERGHRG